MDGQSNDIVHPVGWFESVCGYFGNIFSAVSNPSPRFHRTHSDDDLVLVRGTRAFQRPNLSTDSFEEQHQLMLTSMGSTEPPPEYSMHGIYVPTNIDDWTTFVASLPDPAFPRYRMVLPKKTKILALDLDETLVHSTSKSSGDCDYFVEVLVERSSCLYYVFKRPFVDQFLQTVGNWYHLVIYTASLKEYAEPVVNWLDSGRGLFKKKLFRTVPHLLFASFSCSYVVPDRRAWSRWACMSRICN